MRYTNSIGYAAFAIALFFPVASAYAMDDAVFAECILKRNKTGMSDLGLRNIRQACAYWATPRKCRKLPPAGTGTDQHSAAGSKEDCEEECKQAGYLSRKFGDCSTG
jgi:hypothetical protein